MRPRVSLQAYRCCAAHAVAAFEIWYPFELNRMSSASCYAWGRQRRHSGLDKGCWNVWNFLEDIPLDTHTDIAGLLPELGDVDRIGSRSPMPGRCLWILSSWGQHASTRHNMICRVHS